MAECELSCAKYWVFFFNLLFALSGLAVLVVGIFIQFTYNHYANFVGDTWFSAPVLMIVIGGIIFLVAFFGCCGAIKESSCMMFCFSLCLIAVILLEIGVGVAGFVKHQDLDRILQQGFNKTITHYQDNKVAWGLLQRELHCCGVNGPDDWQVVFHNSTLPPECCRNEVPVCDRNDTGNVIGEGCKAILLNLLDSKALIVGAVGLAVAIIQLIGLGYSCYLYRAFRRNYESV